MREIKFRVWDKNTKRMWYPVAYDWRDNCAMMKDGFLLYKSDIQQYTGIKDKNNRSVFEGDIVKYDGIEDGKPYYCVGEIFWNEAYCGWRIREDVYMPIPTTPWIEVIGNIYENPDLLKGA